MYQIYPRSFCDSTGDGNGDLNGIRNRLDHIQNLGADAIWLSPVYPSPNADWGYDVSDYQNIHPDFGTLDDFRRLRDDLHQRGMRLIMDQVLSHTSNQHPWFIDSMARGAKADWYVWADAKPDGTPPNNWLSDFGGPAWAYHGSRGQYYHHKFMREQPALNFHNPDVQQAALDVLRFWLDEGVDGFRLDVANTFFHNAELTDNPPVPREQRRRSHQFMAYRLQRHIHDSNRPETRGFHTRIRALVDQYPGAFVFAENHEEPDLLKSFYNRPDGLHSFYTPELSGTRLRPETLASLMTSYSEMENAWPCITMSNHDYVRPVSRNIFAGDFPKDSSHQAKFLLMLLFAMRGTVLLYQGEELGLPQSDPEEIEDVKDAFGRLNWPLYKGRDGSRAPIPWRAFGDAMGFSSKSKTWIKMPDSFRAFAAEDQTVDPHSVYDFARRLISLRRMHLPLKRGTLETLHAGEGVWHLRREFEGEVLDAVFCFSDSFALDPSLEIIFGLGRNPREGRMAIGDAAIVAGGDTPLKS